MNGISFYDKLIGLVLIHGGLRYRRHQALGDRGIGLYGTFLPADLFGERQKDRRDAFGAGAQKEHNR